MISQLPKPFVDTFGEKYSFSYLSLFPFQSSLEDEDLGPQDTLQQQLSEGPPTLATGLYGLGGDVKHNHDKMFEVSPYLAESKSSYALLQKKLKLRPLN